MAENENNAQPEVEIKKERSGRITFNNDVVATIAALATVDIPGVAGMSGGFTAGVAELLGRKNLTKGVKVEVGEEECAVDINMIVEYGSKIPEVCANIQRSIREAVESMTGLSVVEVNIHVQGVQMDKKGDEPVVTEIVPADDKGPRVR